MSASQGLHFLRPFIFSPIVKKEKAYARFFSAACSVSRRHHVFTSKARAGAVGSCSRHLHSSAAKNQPKPQRDASQDDVTAATALGNSAADEGRIQKLKEYNALQYPRISSQDDQMSMPIFRKRYQYVTTSTPAQEEVHLHGRIMSIRTSGSKLVFVDLSADFEKVQVMFSLSNVPVEKPEFKSAFHPLLRGDNISVTGTAIRTSAGELSLKATTLPQLLSPSLAPLPERLVNDQTKILNRHVDLLVNRETSDILRLRSHIIKFMRDFFYEQDFLEVQTPMLADYAGGAAARPFLTSATEFPSKELALRIAPELWLKRLVVGGMNRVFEIGSAFRNEGLDMTHNPEFTICEFYLAYANLQDLIAMTQTLMQCLLEHARKLKGSKLPTLNIPVIPECGWAQTEFIPALEMALNFTLPDLSSPDALEQLTKLIRDKDETILASLPTDISLNKLLDYLSSRYLERTTLSGTPTFIMHHPACMAPLSKSFKCPRTGQLVSARAELFIAGREIANMYEEENDPFEQRRKFEAQVRERAKSSDEDEGQARVDESYVQALEHGLPPTGGWGCGVDRLVMLLSGASRISDVLTFGSLRNVVSLGQVGRK